MQEYEPIIAAAGEKYNVDPSLLRSLIMTESSGNPNAVGPETKWGRAQGLAQMIPDTQKRLGITDPFDPEQSIMGAARLLDENLKRYGNLDEAVMAYHGGTNKANWGPKTKDYLKKIRGGMGQPQETQVAQAETGIMTDAAFTPDSDPMWQIMAGQRVAPKESAEVFAPDDDPMWGIMNGQRVAADPDMQPQPAQQQQSPVKQEMAAEKKELSVKDQLQGIDAFSRATTHHISNALLGIVQLGSKAAPTLLRPFSEDAAAGAENFSNRLTGALADREAAYQAETPDGFASYAGAALGEVANPTNALLALKGITAIANPWARGAAMGAGAGAMQPVLDEENFAGNKILQTAGGAALGGVGERVLGGAINRMSPSAPQQSMAPAQSIVPNSGTATPTTMAQQLTGNDLSAAPRPALDRMLSEDAAVAARRADFDEAGVQPTVGQLTRDPDQFSREQNLRGKFPDLANRFSEQDVTLSNRMADLGAREATDAYRAGVDMITELQKIDEPMNRAVNEAYSAVRDSSGRLAELDRESFMGSVKSNLEKSMSESFLPGAVKTMLDDVAKSDVPFDVSKMVEMDKILSRAQRTAQRAGDGNQATAIGNVRDALEATPIKSEAGEEARALYDNARKLARERFQLQEKIPALRSALDDGDPDNFVRKYIIGGKTNEIKELNKIATPELRQRMRGQVAQALQERAFGVGAADGAPINANSYNKMLKELGPEKLREVFGEKDAKLLEAIGRVSRNIKSAPSGASVNYSNTATAIIGTLFNKLGAVPLVNVARGSVREFNEERFAQNALKARIQPSQEARQAQSRLTAPLIGGFVGGIE